MIYEESNERGQIIVHYLEEKHVFQAEQQAADQHCQRKLRGSGGKIWLHPEMSDLLKSRQGRYAPLGPDPS